MKETFPFNGNKNHNYGGACLSIIINFMNNVILIISNTKKNITIKFVFFFVCLNIHLSFEYIQFEHIQIFSTTCMVYYAHNFLLHLIEQSA